MKSSKGPRSMLNRRHHKHLLALALVWGINNNSAFLISKTRKRNAPPSWQYGFNAFTNKVEMAVAPVEREELRSMSFHGLFEMSRELVNGTATGEWTESNFLRAEKVMEALAERPSSRAAMAVERILWRIVQERMAENLYADNVDMTALYTTLILAWASSDVPGGAERAEEILDYSQQIYDERDSEDPLLCGPTIDAFNAVILAYARSGRVDAPQQAVRVLTKLYDLCQSGRTTVTPTTETYAAVLRAWAKKGTADSPSVVRRFLEHMQNLSTKYASVRPDYNCHNEYLSALLESIQRHQLDGRQGAELADEYLRMMLASPIESVRPDALSFNMVLSAWSRSGATEEVLERAADLLAEFETYHRENGRSTKTQPDSTTYNIAMACYTRSSHPFKAEMGEKLLRRMKHLADSGENPAAAPDTISYNVVMNAFAKTRTPNAPLKVEQLLREMSICCDKTGSLRTRPNIRSINTCLDAWAKSGRPESATRIREWIEHLQEEHKAGHSRLRPDKWTYNSYLQALAKSNDPEVGNKAEEVLSEMQKRFVEGNFSLKPDVLTYTSAIHCIALSGQNDSVERALAILNRMEEGNVRPSLYTYNCVINAVAKSKRNGKAHLALKLLRRIQSVALRPQTVTFNNVLNACAFSDRTDDKPEEVITIALDALGEARQGPGANWISYQSAVRVICTQVTDPGERWRLTREVFRECCKDGQLTGTVLSQVRFAVSENEFVMLEKEATDEVTRKLRPEFTVNARKSMNEFKTRAVPTE